MTSTLCCRASSKHSKEVDSTECYIRYKDLKAKEGAVTAKLIRDEKRVLQEDLDKNPRPNVLPYIMAHPDLPGSEESSSVYPEKF